jgi:hypothetical protein
MHNVPLGWWIGRKALWPRFSPGEIHACGLGCVEALKKDGHKNLVWRQILKGKIATEGGVWVEDGKRYGGKKEN